MNERLFLSPPHMSEREPELVRAAFASNWVAPIGPMVDAFERDLAALTGMAHVAALSSGTAALHLALRLIDLRPGDEVWGSTFTFIGGVAPILYENAQPVFIDIDRATLLIDLDLLRQSLEEARDAGQLPRAVITTDLYGVPVDVKTMRALADDYGFVWISDTAEAVGSYVDNLHAGHGADFVVLSFNGNKIITTSGGGALVSNDADMIARARFLSTQARDPAPHYEHSTFGYNYRLSNVCAAIGVGQLEALAERVAARQRINRRYRERLSPEAGISFHQVTALSSPNRWLTTIDIDPGKVKASPEGVRLALERDNVESRPLWKPMHLQPIFRHARAIGGVHAADAFAGGLCLPSGSAMTDSEVDRVCDLVLAALKA